MQCKQLKSLISEEHDVLIIPDIHQDKVRKLLTFLYQGVLDIHRTEVGDFLGLIEQWGLSPEVTFLPKPKVRLASLLVIKLNICIEASDLFINYGKQ